MTASKSRKIIVNADDFGLNAEANRAVVDAFDRGLISSATLMANMPGFEEACEMAHRHKLLGKLGVHLNLTVGQPISAPIRRCSRICDGMGMFRMRRTRFTLTMDERRAVEAELAAQIRACLDRGLHPTHLDSHHHIHTEWAIGAAVITVARRYGIRAVRLSRNCGPGIGLAHRFYKMAYNSRLRFYGLAKTRYFGSCADVQEVLARSSGDVEIMVHLTSEDPEILPDAPASVGIPSWFSTHQLASYL